MSAVRWWFAERWAVLRSDVHDFHSWPGKRYGVTWWEGFVSPRITVVMWWLQRRQLCCGRRKPEHKFGRNNR